MIEIELSNEKIDKIVKSIEHELRNNQFWMLYKHRLEEKIQLLDEKMYKIRGISYDKVPTVSNINQDQKLIKYIEEKAEIEKMIEWINNKNYFTEKFLELLDTEDKAFIRTALLERRSYDTNDTVAVRLGLSESGIRYKIDTIIRKAVEKFLNENKGGVIESKANGGIRDPVK